MISKAYANKILNYICGVKQNTGSLSIPNEVYLGFCVNEPNAINGSLSGKGEPTVTSYARKRVSGSNINPVLFGAAEGGIIKNTEEIQFKAIRQKIGQVNYFFLSPYESASKVPLTGTDANLDAFLWGELINKDDNGNIIKDGDGNPVIGVFIDKETVPVFYVGELQASIDVPLIEE